MRSLTCGRQGLVAGAPLQPPALPVPRCSSSSRVIVPCASSSTSQPAEAVPSSPRRASGPSRDQRSSWSDQRSDQRGSWSDQRSDQRGSWSDQGSSRGGRGGGGSRDGDQQGSSGSDRGWQQQQQGPDRYQDQQQQQQGYRTGGGGSDMRPSRPDWGRDRDGGRGGGGGRSGGGGSREGRWGDNGSGGAGGQRWDNNRRPAGGSAPSGARAPPRPTTQPWSNRPRDSIRDGSDESEGWMDELGEEWEEGYGSEEEDGGQRGARGDRRGQQQQQWEAGQDGHVNHVRRSELVAEPLYGVFPVLNALRSKRRKRMYTLYVLATLDLSKRKDATSIRAVLAAAAEAGVEVTRVTRHELNMLSDDRPHQGLVLDCEPLSWIPLDALPSAEEAMRGLQVPPVWLALDEVMDPQNLGAILRSAYCLGATGLLTSSKNCCPLSPAVSKASAGAMELTGVHAAKSMQRTLQDAASKGWAVLGAAGEAGAKDSSAVKITQPTILVMGNEGYGLRTNIRRACTGLIKVHMGQGMTGMAGIPLTTATPAAAAPSSTTGGQATPAAGAGAGQGAPPRAAGQHQGSQQGSVDSLNVSVATGILLHNMLTSARMHAAAATHQGEAAPAAPAAAPAAPAPPAAAAAAGAGAQTATQA